MLCIGMFALLADSPVVTLTVAAIGLFGVIVGALLPMFADEIRDLLLGRSRGIKDFKGVWECTWRADYGLKAGQQVVDRVEVTKARGDQLSALGANQNGTYPLTGKVYNDDIIVFTYSGEKLKDGLAGVVILSADKRRHGMEGRWDEYSETEKFRGGSTTWVKV